MAATTGIEWTDATVNFWWGCTKVGPGCDHCYAETLSHRWGGDHWGLDKPRRKIKTAMRLLHRLDNDYSHWAADYEVAAGNARAFGQPAPTWGPRRRVFIQSMSDLFDLEVPLEWFNEAWSCIEACDRVDVQIVTKRISAVEKRLAAIGRLTWPRHAGLLVTVVNQDEANRDIPRLLNLKARLHIPWVGISAEPLLGPIDLTCLDTGLQPQEYEAEYLNALTGATQFELDGRMTAFRARRPLDWVIAGGESGHGARPMHPAWARQLRDQCAAAGVPFFFKQWGAWKEGSDFKPDAMAVTYDGRVIAPTPEAMTKADREDRIRDAVMMRNVGKKAAGHLLDGAEHHAFPSALRVNPLP